METTDTTQIADAAPAKKRGRPSGKLAKAAREAKAAEKLTDQASSAAEVPSIAEISRSVMRDDPSDRPEMRPMMREEDPRVRAARRAAELRDHLGSMDESPDDFYIPPSDLPPGWTYEWKRKTLLGQEDPAYQVQLAQRGWEAVPAYRHPSYMPVGYKGATIERKGMILMERPLEITQEARDFEIRKARNQVRQKEAQLAGAPDGQFERNNKDSSLVKVKKSYEAMPIPKD